MSARFLPWAVGMWVGLSVTVCAAYEINTHAKITNNAYDLSRLNTGAGSIQKQLGIYSWTDSIANIETPFAVTGGSKNIYFDIAAGTPIERTVKSFDLKTMTDAKLAPTLALQLPGWLMRGVIREDDVSLTVASISFFRDGAKHPLDDPYGNINRFCNHFMDPIVILGNPTGGGLTGFCFLEPNVTNAAAWALGSNNPFAASLVENASRRNHFTIRDARESMWRGLTLTDKDVVQLPSYAYPQNTYTPEEIRKVYWATTFRALGDVLHTLQDQAQPQHTRNEGHGASNTGYEEYINARATQAIEYKIDGDTLTQTNSQLPDLVYPAYNVPRFNRYSDYWTSANANKFGIADYSNNGFFTFESNFGNTVYANPSSDPAVKTYTPNRSVVTILGAPYNLLMSTVKDNLTNLDTEVISMTTKGLFGELQRADNSITPTLYTLSKANFDDRAKLLIPRAIAYSAGVIDYFFRGEMQISLPAEGVYALADYSEPRVNSLLHGGFNKIKLKLTNKTPDIVPSGGNGTAIPQSLSATGKVVAVVKFRRNLCYVEGTLTGEWPSLLKAGNTNAYLKACRDGSGSASAAPEEIVVSNPVTLPSDLARDSVAPLTFNFTTPNIIPINAVDVTLQVVYRGPLGAEDDAVVVTTKDISEPTIIRQSNDKDYQQNGELINSVCKLTAVAFPGTAAEPFNLAFGNVANPYIVSVNLTPGQYSDVAVLGDNGPISLIYSVAGDVSPGIYPTQLKVSQIDEAGVVTVAPAISSPGTLVPYPSLRGVYADIWITVAYGYAGPCSNGGVRGDMLKLFPDYNPLTPIPITTLNF